MLQPPTGWVYIIVTNWNGWRDTIECLESLFRLQYPNYRIVVCDNDSSDGSLEQIRCWARGEIAAETTKQELLRLTSPPVPKPLLFADIYSAKPADPLPQTARLLLIQTGANRGFAGGCNAGLRYALAEPDCEFAWLLNNDIVVEPDALHHLVRRMQESPEAGICGSTLLFYHDPGRVQVFGGSIYNKWVARGGHIGKLAPVSETPDRDEVERKMAYVYGASMLVRRSFLEQVGLMNEQYFAYFEELDWSERARGRFKLVYSPDSIVYHKEGGTLGSHRDTLKQSPRTEFYMTRNRIVFTRKYHPVAIPSVLAAVSLSAVHRSLNRRWKNLAALFRGALQGITASTTDVYGL